MAHRLVEGLGVAGVAVVPRFMDIAQLRGLRLPVVPGGLQGVGNLRHRLAEGEVAVDDDERTAAPALLEGRAFRLTISL